MFDNRHENILPEPYAKFLLQYKSSVRKQIKDRTFDAGDELTYIQAKKRASAILLDHEAVDYYSEIEKFLTRVYLTKLNICWN